MKKILIIYEKLTTTIDVNISGLKDIFHQEELRFRRSNEVQVSHLQWCDLCLAIRPNSTYTLEIANAIIKSGRVFVSFFDDDIINLPKEHSSAWRGLYARRILSLSHYVICFNPSLLSSYKYISNTPKYVLLNAYVKKEDVLPIEDIDDKIKIVYPAGKDHSYLFEKFVVPSIDMLYEKYEGKVEFHLIGLTPNIDGVKHPNCIIQKDSMPLAQYDIFMKKHRFDIGVAPLDDTPFCNKKYFNKYIEYTKCGIAGLYSNCLPYKYVVKDNYNGLLIENTPADWQKKLDYAINNIGIIKKMVKNAQEDIRSSFSIEMVRSIAYNNIDVLSEQDSSDIINVVFKKDAYLNILFEFRSLLHRLWTHFQHDGVINTVKCLIIRNR